MARKKSGTGLSFSHLSGKSRAKCTGFRNPKSEVRNPKQVKNSKAEILKRSEGLFSFSAVLIFHQLFRVSRFGFPGEVLGSGVAGLGSTEAGGRSCGYARAPRSVAPYEYRS